eukprot:SAG31_NODE_1630_length_7699_cov_36.170921_1_plen_795_part_00
MPALPTPACTGGSRRGQRSGGGASSTGLRLAHATQRHCRALRGRVQGNRSALRAADGHGGPRRLRMQPADRPLALPLFANEVKYLQISQNVPKYLRISNVANGASMQGGACEDAGLDDRGWGCAYRCLQMQSSALRLPVPSIHAIQRELASCGRIATADIGSHKWIEPPDAAAYLLRVHGIRSEELTLHSVGPHEALVFAGRLWEHFKGPAKSRTPVMIDDGTKAYVICGVGISTCPGAALYQSQPSADTTTGRLWPSLQVFGSPKAVMDGVYARDPVCPTANGQPHYSDGNGNHIYFHARLGLWFLNDCFAPDYTGRYASIRSTPDGTCVGSATQSVLSAGSPPLGCHAWQWWDGNKWIAADLTLSSMDTNDDHQSTIDSTPKATSPPLTVSKHAQQLLQYQRSRTIDISPEALQSYLRIRTTLGAADAQRSAKSLWLNLATGHIGLGGQSDTPLPSLCENGNGASDETDESAQHLSPYDAWAHYASERRAGRNAPLVVDLRTICLQQPMISSQSGRFYGESVTAKVFSMEERRAVADPWLTEHLARWGIGKYYPVTKASEDELASTHVLVFDPHIYQRVVGEASSIHAADGTVGSLTLDSIADGRSYRELHGTAPRWEPLLDLLRGGKLWPKAKWMVSWAVATAAIAPVCANEAVAESSSRTEVPPHCSRCQLEMCESEYAGPGYADGYYCDRCRGASAKGHRGGSRRRWFCAQCETDVCFDCVAQPTPLAPHCQGGHTMIVSEYSGPAPGYSTGYFCDRCKKSSVNAGGSRRRWFCHACLADVCFECVPEP